MDFGDDDDEIGSLIPGIVTEYHLVDEKEDPICFSMLPLQWNDEEIFEGAKDQVFIHGEIDDGLQKIYKQVIAWNVDLIDDFQLQILLKDKTWLKIRKPRKSYQDTIRSILITVECLSYLKTNPSASEKSLWDHVRKSFSQFEVSPCKDDLMDQKTLIQSIIKRDESLRQAKVLIEILRSMSKKGSPITKSIEDSPDNIVEDNQKNQGFKNGDGDGDDDGEDGHQNDGYDGHDHVCAICDNGGDLLCCEGGCLRSFHATKSAGSDSQCKTLGYTRAQVKAFQNFVCPNCLHKKHQCFACGKLGNSDEGSALEVIRCMSATCGHFYHPGCVAKLLNPENDDEASSLEAKISSGESFLCPVHKCSVCKQSENMKIEDLQIAICRRCPTTYHRKCLPRNIAFEEAEDEDIEQRAWDDLIPNRILIYCLKHDIDSEIGTPERNHIRFPGGAKGITVTSPASKRKRVLTKVKVEASPHKKKPKNLKRSVIEIEDCGSSKSLTASSSVGKITKIALKGSKLKDDLATSLVLENGFQLPESVDETVIDEVKGDSLFIEEPELDSPVPLIDEDDEMRKPKKYVSVGMHEGKTVKTHMPKRKKILAKRKTIISQSEKEKRPRKLIKLCSNEDLDGYTTSGRPFSPSKSLKDSKDSTKMSLEKKTSSKDEMDVSPINRTKFEHSVDEFDSPITLVDEDARKRILLFIKKSPSSSLRVQDFWKKKRFSAAYLYGMQNISNTITHGKVEASVEAIRAALQKFENGGNIEDAKAVCGPDILNQMVIWKKKLRGYLGPLLHGMHDRSLGHDVKGLKKVEEIVDRVHWYIADGDMVVDACCGPKDFSPLARSKLESSGKNCSFKDYDIFLPAKDLNSDRRGWMAVQLKDLQRGSQLVIQLDLPIGVNASFTHKLIDKALYFKPKILLLLSRKEINRLGTQVEETYDLIWEEKLAGQPGSGEASQSQISGRNQKLLFLSLWSRSDWTSRHRMMAINCGHCLNDMKVDHNLKDEAVESENVGSYEVEENEIIKFSKREKPRMRSEERIGERMRDLPLEMGLLPSHQTENPEPSSDRGKQRERNNESYHQAQSYGQDERQGERSRSLAMGFHHHRIGERSESLHEHERTPEPMHKEKSGERNKLGLRELYGEDEHPGEKSRSLERGVLHRQSLSERSPMSRLGEKSGERNEGYHRVRPYGQDETVPLRQVDPERSPKTSEREKQKETTKMKYHWTCLYAKEDQPAERTSAEPSDTSLLRQPGPESQTDTPDPINREKLSGEKNKLRNNWSDLYPQGGEPEVRDSCGPSEMRPSLPHRQSSLELHYRHTRNLKASERQLSITPSFPNLRERESQARINEEMSHHSIDHEFDDFQRGRRYSSQLEQGQGDFSHSSPSFKFYSGSAGYQMKNYRQSGRMRESSEQMGPAHLLPRYDSSLPHRKSHRSMSSDVNRYPFS